MNFTAKFKTGNLTDKDVSDMISDIRKNYDMNHLTTAHLTNYFGLKTQQICKFVQYHPEIEIERRPAGSKRNPHFELVWSESSVRDFIFTYLREKFPAADPITSPLSSAYQIANQQIAAPTATLRQLTY